MGERERLRRRGGLECADTPTARPPSFCPFNFLMASSASSRLKYSIKPHPFLSRSKLQYATCPPANLPKSLSSCTHTSEAPVIRSNDYTPANICDEVYCRRAPDISFDVLDWNNTWAEHHDVGSARYCDCCETRWMAYLCAKDEQAL
jgi:hypothetical protein